MQWLTWQQAGMLTVLSALVVIGTRRLPSSRATRAIIPAAWEFGFVAFLYMLWRLARFLPLTHDDGAIDRARSLARFQDAIGLPSEISVQEFVVRHDWLAWFSSAFYATVHVPSIIVFLVWMYGWHRQHYRRWRTALAILTGFCLVIRYVRVAPPRFITELGFVDLSTHYGMSVYGPVGTGVSDQFAAMPSIHVAWAAVIAFGMMAALQTRWRWLGPIHLALTIFVVAATGHHWWLDGIVAMALLGIALQIDWVGRHYGPSGLFRSISALYQTEQHHPPESVVAVPPVSDEVSEFDDRGQQQEAHA